MNWKGRQNSTQQKKFKPNPDLKLMDQVHEVLRFYHYANRTEQSYSQWIRRFLVYYNFKVHPKEQAEPEVEGFLSHLATDLHVSVATQKQALNALVFLFDKVLDKPLGKFNPARSKKRPRIPTVFTVDEVQRIFSHLAGRNFIMAGLLYGCGLRLMECIRLRIKDIDFGQ